MDGAPQRDEAIALRMRAAREESGFTLIEVVVALMLIGVVAAGALMFFIRGMQTTSHLQRTQAAASIATQWMERVRAVDPRPATPGATSPLIVGRTAAAVTAAWDTADPADVQQTIKEYDHGTTTTPTIPVTGTVTVSDMEYTITTLIGSCYRPKASSAMDQPCTAVPDTTLGVKIYRATVVVSWGAGTSKECDTGTCTYRLSALIDPTADAEWNITEGPFVYAESADCTVGESKNFVPPALAGIAYTTNPTTITAGSVLSPVAGTVLERGSATVVSAGSAGSVPAKGSINYVCPTNYSGLVQVMYTINDGVHPTSDAAALNITVLPKALADSGLTMVRGSALDIDVVANDLPSAAGLVPQPEAGPLPTGVGVSVVGSSIRVTTTNSTPTGGSAISFKYKVTDSNGKQSIQTATVTIAVTLPAPPPPPGGSDMTFGPIPAVSTSSGVGLVDLNFGLPAGQTVRIVDNASGGGTITTSGSDIATHKYQRAANKLGAITFRFKVVAPGNILSAATYTGTILVVPEARNYAHPDVINNNGNNTISPRSKNAPSEAVTGVKYSAPASPVPSCSLGSTARSVTNGTVSRSSESNGTYVFKKPRWSSGNSNADCTFSYTVSYVLNGKTYSSPATVTVKVKR